MDELKAVLARIASKNHFNGARNPRAQFRREMSVEQLCGMPAGAGQLSGFDCAGGGGGGGGGGGAAAGGRGGGGRRGGGGGRARRGDRRARRGREPVHAESAVHQGVVVR